ncbi:MerR family transcriptional regulator [Jatrophihabitans sp.]|uniref:MerR family transcriptional regulator n=1 Tax=Jatrophihabitans sp. TaxID=1932789 RepID=UPI0038CD1990
MAAQLGVSPSTVRMWGRRYGLVASARSEGGHRRYTSADVERLHHMHAAVISGETPAAAAALVLAGKQRHDDATDWPVTAGTSRYGGGFVLALPGAGRTAQGIGRAASRLDEIGAREMTLQALHELKTTRTWNQVLRPVLVATGVHWQHTGTGIEIEHLLTQAITAAFATYVSQLPEPAQDRPVVLAGGPREDHVLTLLAVRGALAERGVPVRTLGARTPTQALTSTATRIRAAAVFIWATKPANASEQEIRELSENHRGLTVVLGGAGWRQSSIGSGTVCTSLEQAADLLDQSWRRKVRKGLSENPSLS